MPGEFITLPTVQETGFSGLGNAIAQGTGDYARLQLQKQDEDRRRQQQLDDQARARQQQLADVQSARDFSTKTAADERKSRITDAEAEKLYAIKTELGRLGYLNLSDFDDPAALQAAIAKSHQDGLLTRYKGALDSGDLSYSDLGDDQKVAAGLAKYSSRLARQTTTGETSQANAQDEADSLKSEYDSTLQQTKALEGDLSKPVEASIAPPSQAEVQAAAFQLAQQASPGKPPSQKDINAQMPVAQQALQQQKLDAAVFRRQQTQERVKILRDSLTSIGSRLTNLANKNVFPASSVAEPDDTPAAGPPAPAAPSVDAATARRNAMQSIVDAVKAPAASAAPAVQPTPPAAAAPPPTTDPLAGASDAGFFQRPTQRFGRASVLAPETSEMFDTAASAIKSELVRLSSAPPTRATTGRVTYLNGLLSQIAQGKTALPGASSLAPAASDAMSTTPFGALQTPTPWWAQASGY